MVSVDNSTNEPAGWVFFGDATPTTGPRAPAERQAISSTRSPRAFLRLFEGRSICPWVGRDRARKFVKSKSPVPGRYIHGCCCETFQRDSTSSECTTVWNFIQKPAQALTPALFSWTTEFHPSGGTTAAARYNTRTYSSSVRRLLFVLWSTSDRDVCHFPQRHVGRASKWPCSVYYRAPHHMQSVEGCRSEKKGYWMRSCCVVAKNMRACHLSPVWRATGRSADRLHLSRSKTHTHRKSRAVGCHMC